MAETLPSTAKNVSKIPLASTDRAYKVALLCGGTSNEREISLLSADNVRGSLAMAGHEVMLFDTADPGFITALNTTQPEVAFIALHGKGGEDGAIQAVLELMGIPYTGSGVLGSALAMDKHRSKIIYKALGLKTAPWIYLRACERDTSTASTEHILKELSLPVVVKPSDDGSSVGITIVKKEEDLQQALKEAFSSGSDVLVEAFVSGVEITVSVLGSNKLTALPAIEIIPKNEFYDYESKYAKGGSEHIIPARIDAQALEEASRIAIAAHEMLDCYGVSRSDMIVDKHNGIWVIETNTIPGMTGTSLLPDAAAHVGISNKELYDMLIAWALERGKS